ncbi:tryptophan synthase, alpha subunit [Desulfatibacillum aliphaticivorans]|uniref:Tryptophan synthase alpha chain n=1 Tax=Desulfatibacillum aliphaticivorans TaxID=218208 RepID=TRPA_DESAL|nr:tryptophan synthase subunit alpha [Desulfatibacillum aliphaticivorans]B8FA37.1 RecName: Full=Tryptophan synthase alpha chain [Desulfatibacillum aliphaticivorans]ACL03133.1 tryptophan synthase, alpha subunit [Desulfatibacillum aliphaticivorans]
MSCIKNSFEALKAKNEKALVGFVTAGDPDFGKSVEIVKAMCEGGMDVLELGIPFSDPTADGPVIQRSSQRALSSGMSLPKVLEMVKIVRGFTKIPIVLFGYYNPIFSYGGKRFYEDALAAGADGVLIVDLPPEESAELTSLWEGDDFDFIRLVAPTTGQDRMKQIAGEASGFIYLVSMTGVTGSQGLDSSKVADVNAPLKAVTDLPVCVGFGISTPEHVKAVAAVSDGVVVGSAFERLIEENLENRGLHTMVQEYTESLKAATRG